MQGVGPLESDDKKEQNKREKVQEENEKENVERKVEKGNIFKTQLLTTICPPIFLSFFLSS